MPFSPKFNHSITRTRMLNMFLISIPALLFVTSSFWFGVILGQCTRNSGTWSVRVLWQKNTSSERLKGLNDISASDLEKSVYVNANADPVTDLSVRRHRVMAFVGIMTGYASSGRRRSLRNTWMPSDQQSLRKMEEATGLAFRFIIGKTNDKAKNQELHKELLKYDDFMVLDFLEEAIKPPYKIYSFFKAAYALFECEYYVKVQDDIYLRPDRLSLLLAKDRPHSHTYLGCMSRSKAEAASQLEMYEKRLLGSENVLHAQGSIYAFSADIVANLVALGQNSLRMFHSEEVTVGAWMLAMNVNYEDNKQLCESTCSSRSIVVTDFPNCSGLCDAEERLLQLHGQAACSKSPTHSENQILRFLEWGNLLQTQARKGQGRAGNRRLP